MLFLSVSPNGWNSRSPEKKHFCQQWTCILWGLDPQKTSTLASNFEGFWGWGSDISKFHGPFEAEGNLQMSFFQVSLETLEAEASKFFSQISRIIWSQEQLKTWGIFKGKNEKPIIFEARSRVWFSSVTNTHTEERTDVKVWIVKKI